MGHPRQNSSQETPIELDDGPAGPTPLIRAQSALPPTDEGKRAWTALFGAFLSNALIWGLALSFGVLQKYYASNEPFSEEPAGIAAIGTTATGIMYLTMPLFLMLFQRKPRWRQYALYASIPFVLASLVGASFAQTVPQLLVCQGVFYALAGNALVMPTINYINEWFVRKRGLAIGVAIAGDGLGGAAMPIILEAMLPRIGFRWSLRAIAFAISLLALPLPFVLKPRLPIPAATARAPLNVAFLRSPFFWVLQTLNFVQALGYFLPGNYLPTIAGSMGLGSTLSSLTVLLVNLGLTIGCVIVGILVDRFDTTLVISGISLASSLAVFAILGVSTSIAPLYVFALAYGLTAGAYSTTWGGLIKDLQRSHGQTDANLVFGLLAAARGLGSIISGPLSESLLQGSVDVLEKAPENVYSSPFLPLIIFSGCTASVGGAAWMAKRLGTSRA